MEVLLRADTLLRQRKLVEAVAEYTSTIQRLSTQARDSGSNQVLSSALNNRGQCHYLQVIFPVLCCGLFRTASKLRSSALFSSTCW